jgi:hypothetical protein
MRAKGSDGSTIRAFFLSSELLTPMRPYPLPKDITREEFNGLVTDLYQLLAAKGIDPGAHLTVGDFDDSVGDKARTRFALYLSYTATEIVLKTIE